MAISVVLPHALLPYAQGKRMIVVEESCGTVREALAVVASHWPAVTDRVLTEQGDVRKHVNVFVGDESIKFMNGLSTPLDESSVITIVPAVSGG